MALSGGARNQQCACGSGQKRKHCACQTRRPRTTSIVLDYGEEVINNEVRISPTGELTFSLNGTTRRPVAGYLETTYERTAKQPKVIHRTPLDPGAPLVNPNLALERFDLLLAVDTNTIQTATENISVACLVRGDFADFGQKVLVGWEPKQLIELRNVVGPPENVVWQLVSEHLAANSRFESLKSIGIVVDSNFDLIPAYNSRTEPIIGDFFLPPKIELLYASADTGSEFVANKMLSRANRESEALLRQVVSGALPDDGLLEGVDRAFKSYRVWLPTKGKRLGVRHRPHGW
jgi:hypothetical protein